MNLIRQIINWLRGKKNEAAEAVFKANVEGNSQLAIDDAKTNLAKYNEKLARLIATNKDNDNAIEGKKRKIQSLLEIAKKAASRGEEAEAKKAIEMKNTHCEELKILERDSELNQKIINQSKLRIQEFNNKIEKAERDRARLIAQRNNAKIRQTFADSETGLEGSFLDDLNMLQREVNEEENLAFAKEELAGIGTKNIEEELENKYLSASSSVDDEYQYLIESLKK